MGILALSLVASLGSISRVQDARDMGLSFHHLQSEIYVGGIYYSSSRRSQQSPGLTISVCKMGLIVLLSISHGCSKDDRNWLDTEKSGG